MFKKIKIWVTRPEITIETVKKNNLLVKIDGHWRVSEDKFQKWMTSLDIMLYFCTFLIALMMSNGDYSGFMLFLTGALSTFFCRYDIKKMYRVANKEYGQLA